MDEKLQTRNETFQRLTRSANRLMLADGFISANSLSFDDFRVAIKRELSALDDRIKALESARDEK